MCAMIPMFRQRFRGIVRATVSNLSSAGLAIRGKTSLKLKTKNNQKLFTEKLFLYHR
jgi:hypothetical protein